MIPLPAMLGKKPCMSLTATIFIAESSLVGALTRRPVVRGCDPAANTLLSGTLSFLTQSARRRGATDD